MRRSVGSGPMPHADSVAAPAPVTPRTFRNRRRSIGSGAVISVMAHAAVASHVVLNVTADAPAHAQRRDLLDLRRLLHVAMAGGARRWGRAEGLDVALVRKMHEAGYRVDANPLRRFLFTPGVADFFDLGLMRRRRTADQLVTTHARLEGRNPRLARNRGRVVAIHARDLVLPGMDIVTKENRLARSVEIAGVADDGSSVPRCLRGSRLGLLAVKDHRREGENQHHDRS